MTQLETNTASLRAILDAVNNLPEAGGSAVEFTITVNVDSGATVTATKGDLSVSGTSVDGVCVLTVPEAGTWTLTSVLGDKSRISTIEVYDVFPITVHMSLDVNYTGTMTYEDDETTGYRYFTLTDSGVLTIDRPTELDYWICGGGGNGSEGGSNSTVSKRYGGGGGGGGYFKSGKNNTDTEFTIEIGANTANSSFSSPSETITAGCGSNGGVGTSAGKGAGGGNGGSGGGAGDSGSNTDNLATGGTGCGVSTLPFEDSHFTSYPCAGGAGGYCNGTSGTTSRGGSNGANGGDGNVSGGTVAAETGGGYTYRVSSGSVSAMPATYYGSGGAGGSGGLGNMNTNRVPSNGYQGVCFLRIPLYEF